MARVLTLGSTKIIGQEASVKAEQHDLVRIIAMEQESCEHKNVGETDSYVSSYDNYRYGRVCLHCGLHTTATSTNGPWAKLNATLAYKISPQEWLQLKRTP